MDANVSEVNERDVVFQRGRRAVFVLLVANAAALALAAGFWLTPYPDVGRYILLWFAGIQLLFGFLWFLPVFLFHLVLRRRSLAESSARALWSFVDAIGYVSP